MGGTPPQTQIILEANSSDTDTDNEERWNYNELYQTKNGIKPHHKTYKEVSEGETNNIHRLTVSMYNTPGEGDKTSNYLDPEICTDRLSDLLDLPLSPQSHLQSAMVLNVEMSLPNNSIVGSLSSDDMDLLYDPDNRSNKTKGGH